MKKTNILYWIFTSIFAAFMLLSAVPDIISDPVAVQGMHVELGYPKYFIPFIGVAKLLGAIAILVPGFHRIKEWAFAGFAFDLLGATYSIISIGKPDWMFMALPLLFLVIAYTLYHKRKDMKEHVVTPKHVDERLLTSAAL